MSVETGQGLDPRPANMVLRPSGTSLPAAFPVVVSQTFPETNFAGVGDEVRLTPLRIEHDIAVVVGLLESFPTVDPALGDVAVIDLPTYQMMGYEPGFGVDDVDSYWIDVESEHETVVSALQSSPLESFAVTSQERVVDGLVSDPVALGTIGALTVGFVAAAVFAAVGFAVSATVSARERLVEFGLLRALGLTPRQLGWWLFLEQGALVVVSLILGTLVGWVLTGLLVPLVTLTQDGSLVVPQLIVQYPWRTIAGLEIAVVVVLGLIVTALTLILRRVGLGSLLRLGGE